MILLGDLKPGEFIKYDYLVGYSDICTGQGTITEITEKAIRVRKKSGHYDVLRIRDIERNETRILGREPKKEENEMCKRGAPDCKKLRKAYQESGYNISAVQREFKTHWNTARRWLFEAGLIDEISKPTEKAKGNKPKQMFSEKEERPMETAIEETSKGEEVLDSIDAGKKPKATDEKCRNCGRTIPGDEVKYWHRGWMCNECAGSVLDASLKPDEAVKAESHDHHINAEPPDASPGEFNAGEVSHAMPDAQTPVSEPAGSQYEPEDNDYQDEIDKAVAQAAASNFNRKAFVIQMIEATMENARNAKAPADLTLELIDAILVVA